MGEPFSIAASAFTVIGLAASIAERCTEYWGEVSSARADIERIRNEVATLNAVAKDARQLIEAPRGARLTTSRRLHAPLQTGEECLRTLYSDLEPSNNRSRMRRFGIRALRWPFQSQDVQRRVEEISRCREMLTAALLVDQTNLALHHDEIATLERLPVAEGASFPIAEEAGFDLDNNRRDPTCLPDTRVELLSEIHEWIQDETGKSMFWLNGMAGTGKSTISRTLVHSLHKNNCLGASFFFKRGPTSRGNISKFFPTIMHQFANQERAIIPYLKDPVDSEVFNKDIGEQFRKLMLKPLSEFKAQLNAQPNQTFLIIVDALDECDYGGDVQLLVKLLSKLKQARVKVFLTSRPEHPVLLGFMHRDVLNMYQDVVLHDIAGTVVQRDIRIFLEHELSQIKDDYNSPPGGLYLPPEWPGQEHIQTLASMAAPLFIFAATVCRFIGDKDANNPEKRLQEVLSYQTKREVSRLGATYGPVLERGTGNVSSRERAEIWCRFREVVGSIISLANPLSVSALAQLLEKEPQEIHAELRLSQSVLRVSSDGLITLFHNSFGDFVMDPEKMDEPFWINEKGAHTQLAQKCLRILNKSLQTDICRIGYPGTILDDIDQEVRDRIQPEVEYACRFWTYHLSHSEVRISDSHEVYSFLTTHFLHWLEVLYLTVKHTYIFELIHTMTSMVEALRNLVTTDNASRIQSFLDDAIQFIQALDALNSTRYVKTAAPLQIYCSALLFTPKKSIIRTLFDEEIPHWVLLKPELRENWADTERNSEGRRDCVYKVTISPDSSIVASVSNNRAVQLWCARSGAHRQTLPVQSGIASVAFSPHNRFLALGLHDHTAQLWDVERGAHHHTFRGHSSLVQSVTLSPENSVLASGSWDKTIRLWDAGTGACQRTLQGRDFIVSLAFSTDGSVLASGSVDKTIQLWDWKTGVCKQIFEGHDQMAMSVGFSRDNTVLASALSDKTIWLWEVATSECLQTVKLDTMATEIRFSDDSMSLVTNIGPIAIASSSQLASSSTATQDTTASLLRSANPTELRELDLGYGTRGRWITRHGRNVLLLPSDHWLICTAIRGSAIAMGGRSESVVIMKFTDDSIY